jgi:glutaredoxin
LFGSTEIIAYLFNTYGPGESLIPNNLRSSPSSPFPKFLSGQSSGSKLRIDARPDAVKLKPITIWGWEGAPYVKDVRKTLTELGLAHIFVNCANGSQNRNSLIQKTKLFQVPYIVDPNTGVEMFESKEIVKYLESTYTV